MQNSNTFYLLNAVYLSEKKRVSIEFSNSVNSRSISFPFVPFILVPDSLVHLTSGFIQKNRLKTEKALNGIRVFSADFSVLSEINFLSGKKCILLPAETQFLLLNNWSFFDEFVFEKEINKTDLTKIPELKFNFSADFLEQNISELLAFSSESGKEFIKKIVLSNLLCRKLSCLPLSKHSVIDAFIESVLFRNNFAFEKKLPKFDSGFTEKSSGQFSEVDFSFVFASLFSFPFHNLGFDSVNCSCCRPDSVYEKNVLPSSLAEVEFVQDAIYFQPSNKAWNEFFDSVFSGKEKRLKRKAEWNLRSLHAGPFFM